MKTAAQQIGAYKLISENKPTAYDEALLLSMIEEAELRAEQRVRADIARDSERLDWLGGNVTLSARYFLRGGWAVMHLDEALGHGETLRQAIDAAREVG